MNGIVTDAAVQILCVIAGALALNWCLAERDRAKARRGQAIAKALERLHTVTKPLNLGTINEGGAAVRFMRQKFAADEVQRKWAGMLQMAERVAQAAAADSGETKAMTHYEVLDVSEKATAAVIKSTYRLLMKAFHPDYLANSSGDLTTQQAVEIVEAINAAYFVLSNPSRRANYDAQLASERAAVYVPQTRQATVALRLGHTDVESTRYLTPNRSQARREKVNRMFD